MYYDQILPKKLDPKSTVENMKHFKIQFLFSNPIKYSSCDQHPKNTDSWNSKAKKILEQSASVNIPSPPPGVSVQKTGLFTFSIPWIVLYTVWLNSSRCHSEVYLHQLQRKNSYRLFHNKYFLGGQLTLCVRLIFPPTILSHGGILTK